jgi:ATP-dependent protease ClpP protease subunit
MAEEPKGGYTKEPDKIKKQVLSGILEEYDVVTRQREIRKAALEEMEKHSEGKTSAFISFLSSETIGASIDSDDIPAFGDILMSVGEVDQLNLIINSPGGDGTVAEKIIELCRAYCKEFNVIVPNRAKSAATIIALGGDQIVMGYCSELGPIDAQVMIIVGGIPHYISAQSFLDARDVLEDRYRKAIKEKQDPKPVLQQIASLDAPFIDHCEKLMEFSREVARKYLAKYMFSAIKPAAKQKQAIDKVLERLSSVNIFKVHGRMIDGNTAKTDLGLSVRLLGKDDAAWKALWHYYVRADVLLKKHGVAKVIESKSNFLVKGVSYAE